MGSLIMIGIKPDLIDAEAWKLTFDDAMKISKRGELSYRQEKTKYGARYVSNCISEPIFDKRVRANRWISSGDLVMGVTVDDFTLVDDIAFYQWVYDRAETKSLWDCDVLDKNGEGYLTLWYGDTMCRRAHTWLLAIACLLYSRFPDAVDINGASTATDFLRATAIAGDVVGEPIAIPKKYSKCDVTKVASELMGDADQPKYDCNVVTDLYYWDQEEDSVDPRLDSALKHYMKQIDEFGSKHMDKLEGMDKKDRLEFLGRLMQREKSIPEKECVVPDKVWDKLIQNINDDNCLKPYIGLYSVDTEDIACAQLVNLLVTNYELFQYYWKRHLMSYSTNR